MRILLFLFCAGILLGSFLANWMLVLSTPVLVFCSLMLLHFSWFKLCQERLHCLKLSLVLLLGVAWHGMWAQEQLGNRLPRHLEGVDLTVVGVVKGLPQQTELTQRFEFSIEQGKTGVLDRKIRLDYYGDKLIKGGQRWEFQVRLKQARGFANKGGFDFEAWSLQKGLNATGYVRPGSEILVDTSLSLRAKILEQLQQTLKEAKHTGIILALTLGDKNSISSDYWDLFSKTGTNHLWVISGLHIGFIAGLFFMVSGFILRLFPALFRQVPLPVLSGLTAMLAAAAYAYLAGFSLSTQRALIMLVVIIGGSLWNKKISWDLRWLLALALVLCINPLAGMNPGFWFSFIAVASLLLFAENTPLQAASKLKTFLLTQWRVWLALFIPLGFWFGQIPVSSPLINIFAIPLVGMVIVPLSLLLIPLVFITETLSHYLMWVIDLPISFLFAFLEVMMKLVPNQGLIYFSSSDWVVLVMLGVATMILLLPTPFRVKTFSLPLFLPLLFPNTAKLNEGEWTLNVFDVGQGLAVLVKTREHSLLFDTAAGTGVHNSIANSEIIPSLRKQHINHLDALVISHGDNDHSGGARSLIDKFSVGTVFTNGAKELNQFNPSICSRGVNWWWNGVSFSFLHTPDEFKSSNNNSCVLRIAGLNQSALLPGDIERESEYALSAAFRAELGSTILLAPHHGSNTSSSYAFIKQVDPDHVVFSVAYRNQFGHPTQAVIDRYKSFNSKNYSTADLGMVSFDIGHSHQEPYIRGYRRANPRYWRYQTIE